MTIPKTAKTGTTPRVAARNSARDLLRRRRRRVLALEPWRQMDPTDEAAPDPAEALDRRETLDTARRALAGLPARQREVFDLVDLQGLAPHEAAAMLGLSQGTIRVHLFRARRAVRSAFLALEPALLEDRP